MSFNNYEEFVKYITKKGHLIIGIVELEDEIGFRCFNGDIQDLWVHK